MELRDAAGLLSLVTLLQVVERNGQWIIAQIWPTTCICMAWEQIVAFILLSNWGWGWGNHTKMEYSTTCENLKFKLQCPQVCWSTATFIHFCIVCSCFNMTTAQWVVAIETVWPQSQKYSLSGPLQRKMADPWSKERKELLSKQILFLQRSWDIPSNMAGVRVYIYKLETETRGKVNFVTQTPWLHHEMPSINVCRTELGKGSVEILAHKPLTQSRGVTGPRWCHMIKEISLEVSTWHWAGEFPRNWISKVPSLTLQNNSTQAPSLLEENIVFSVTLVTECRPQRHKLEAIFFPARQTKSRM